MPLEKNPGLQPIVVGEELCRIAGKVVMNLVKDDETKAVENLQLCGGKDAGCETAVHSMYAYLEQMRQKQFYLLMLKAHSIP